MLEWQRECGDWADALKLQAQLNPTIEVPGWTDRPQVAIEHTRYWASFCDWLYWGEWGPSSAVQWVESQFSDETAEQRGALAWVFLALARRWRELTTKKPAEPPADPVE